MVTINYNTKEEKIIIQKYHNLQQKLLKLINILSFLLPYYSRQLSKNKYQDETNNRERFFFSFIVQRIGIISELFSMRQQIFSGIFSNDIINMFLDLIIDYCDDLIDFIGNILG